MHLFFNDPRATYVTRHRRIVRHPLLALVAGGVGVAALGVAIGAAGWEPAQQGRPAPEAAQQLQGVAMPDPVLDVNLYGVPAAPQPVLDFSTAPQTQPAPTKAQVAAKAKAKPQAQAKRVEKAKVATTPAQQEEPEPTVTAAPTQEPTAEPTQEPTQAATQEPTQAATQDPAQGPWWHVWPHVEDSAEAVAP